ncbi:MAG: T9SS type A sorting domain-containing protein, partial [Flavobacteriales bacterium]|nr:T9SS type A sorting domain-containing protein [Flavobacteriales bacterium]
TSVTTQSSPIASGMNIIQAANPHMKYIDLTKKGYLILDLTNQAAQSDWYYVSDISNPTFTSAWGAGWKTNDGDNHLTEASSEAPAGVYPPLAPPLSEVNVGMQEDTNEPIIISAYPNPFVDRFVVQFNLFEAGNVEIALSDISGKQMLSKEFSQLHSGLHYIEIQAENLNSGTYIFTLNNDSNVIHRRMSKIQ